jgi:hypothetical protein
LLPKNRNGNHDFMLLRFHAEVAQLVEHLTENQRVPSSSLGLGTLTDLSRKKRRPDQT